ncbi:MAG: pentapeptide repeat-containing protein [Alphaproteobacteria bacterium]|nr:pentapeptide repeat-containing protein [Alphaproteobacteria bacterium]
MGLLDKLQAGDVAGFNDGRDDLGREELFAAELAELVLHGVDLSGVNLDKADLTGTDLTEANLVRASMSDVDGAGLILDGALAMKVRLRDAWLEDADLTGADLSGADLAGAVLHRSKGEAVRLLQARLKDVGAHEASWPLADLSEATLKGADFTGADLSRARLVDAKAGGCTLAGARLDGIDAAGVRLGGANLAGATLSGARLAGAHLAGADLSGADLRHADLSRANLTGAVMTGANLSGASLVDACLDQVDLAEVTLTEADLSGLDPVTLGLADAVVEELAAHGARFDPDAPLVFDDPAVACVGDAVGCLWLNADGPETLTLRWAVQRPGAVLRTGVLPVSGTSVLFHGIVARDDGFSLVALLERADGVVASVWPLPADGRAGRPVVSSLGYEPAVQPAMRREGDAVWLFGIARQGPTIVVHRDRGDGEGFTAVGSTHMPQARGFLGRTHPVLVSKGGVAMAIQPQGPMAPHRMPDGFPATTSAAAPAGDRVVAVWNTLPQGKDPGGLRSVVLGDRHAREPRILSTDPRVSGLDAVPDGDVVRVAWTQDDGAGGGTCHVVTLPDGEPTTIPTSDGPFDDVRLVRHADDDSLRLVLGTADGRVIVCGLDGRGRVELTDPDA